MELQAKINIKKALLKSDYSNLKFNANHNLFRLSLAHLAVTTDLSENFLLQNISIIRNWI